MLVSSAIGVLICFALLILAAYKKISMFLAAVIGSCIVCLFSGLDIIEVLTSTFKDGFVGFIGSWMIIIALGALLGNLYGSSGAAWRISDTLIRKTGVKWSLVVYILVGGLLVYGGIQVPVMVFVLLPFAKVLFKKAGIPWYLFPGITALSIATFAMGMLPGSLQMQNMIPSRALGTSLMAAPVEGILATIFILVVGIWYINREIKKGKDDPMADISKYQVSGDTVDEEVMMKKSPSFLLSLIPMLVALVLINFFKVELMYGLAAGCILAIIFFYKSLDDVKDAVSKGFNEGIFPCVIIGAVVALGKVIGATPIFALIEENIVNIPLSGLPKIATITTLMAGITGSASGGVTMVLELFGDTFVSWGYSPDIIHRVASIACGGLDTLPWNGTVVMLFTLSGVSYSKGYKMVAVQSVILPLLALIPVFIYYYLTMGMI